MRSHVECKGHLGMVAPLCEELSCASYVDVTSLTVYEAPGVDDE